MVGPADGLPPGPHLLEDGLVLTFWRLVEPALERPEPGETGRALRELHDRLDGYPGAPPPLAAVLDEARMLIDRHGLDMLVALGPSLSVVSAW